MDRIKIPNAYIAIAASFILTTTEAFSTPLTFLAHRQAKPSFKLYSIDNDELIQFNIDTDSETSFSYAPSLPESQYTQVLTSKSLEPIATKLRSFYDDHFQDPRQPDSGRFCWDPWFVNVGDGKQLQTSQEEEEEEEISGVVDGEKLATDKQCQYSLKRIQSNNFFSEDDFSDLVEDLTQLGRSIGLTAITPPWISLYTNGDMQNLHTDSPQGPCAFVLSLCRDGEFDGGETMLLRSEVLELWKGFDGSKGLETGGIMRYIPPTPLGRCIAFDPRVPHGVNKVIGTQDPRRGRVVVHGWFNEPEVCWFGPWTESEVGEMNAMLDESLQPLVETIGGGEIGRVCGYLACRIEVDQDGFPDDVMAVCDTLQADWEDFRGVIGYDEADRPVLEDAVLDIKLTIYESLKNLNFGEGEDGRSVVIPFAFV